MPRSSRFLLLPLTSFLLPGAASAQLYLAGAPLYSSVDPRSTALAGNGAAHLGDPAAWHGNPAAQGGTVGVGIICGNRTLPLFTETVNHSMLGAWAATPAGTFGARFNKFDLGTFQQTFENGATGALFSAYDQMVSFTYASPAMGPVIVGGTVKWYESNNAPSANDTVNLGMNGSGTWFDLGAIFSTPGFSDDGKGGDTIRIGASVSNLGGRLEYGAGSMQADEVRQWFRAGLAYETSFGTGENSVKATASAEYRRLLSPDGDDGGDMAGIGLEATVLELLTVRLGTSIQSFSDIYAEEGTPALRYGLGVNVPLKRLGSDLPVSFALDYGVAGLNSASYSADNSHVFGFRLTYTESLF